MDGHLYLQGDGAAGLLRSPVGVPFRARHERLKVGASEPVFAGAVPLNLEPVDHLLEVGVGVAAKVGGLLAVEKRTDALAHAWVPLSWGGDRPLYYRKKQFYQMDGRKYQIHRAMRSSTG